jgi:hypothetical protein
VVAHVTRDGTFKVGYYTLREGVYV